MPTSERDLLVDDPWAAIEACFDAGWSDGLPVVPPTEALVSAVLDAGPWSADEVLLIEPSRGLEVTAFNAAVNAVLAGCRPEYFPVVGAVLKAMSHPRFGLHAVLTSTGGAAVLIAVNGPVRDQIGMNAKENLLGGGNRANSTIGRAVRLVARNCLLAVPGLLDKSTQGWAGKISMCFAEDEASSPWGGYHTLGRFPSRPVDGHDHGGRIRPQRPQSRVRRPGGSAHDLRRLDGSVRVLLLGPFPAGVCS
ncbi:MAG: hypothetical protein R2733_10350 [Acidimicrobiales bacterium]